MTSKEQYEHCEVCDYHRIVTVNNGFRFMGCHYGDYKNHPVWDDFKCPLDDNKPIREKKINEFGLLEV